MQSELVRMLSISIKTLNGLVIKHGESIMMQTEPFLIQSNSFRKHV